MYSILDCVPNGYTLRSIQRDFLLHVEENWDKKVIVGNLPVAAGKSLCLITIANWCVKNQLGSVAGIVPTIILQDQYQDKHPDIHMLKGMRHYSCRCKKGKSCADTKAKEGRTCQTKELENNGHSCCHYIEQRDIAVNSKFSLFNFHSMSYNRIFKKILICDEGHNTRSHLIDRFSIKLWKHECNYPNFEITDNFYDKGERVSVPSFISWLQKYAVEQATLLSSMIMTEIDTKIVSKQQALVDRLNDLNDVLKFNHRSMLIIKEKAYYSTHDKQYKNLDRTDQERILIKPLDLKWLGEKYLWPKGKTDKIIFLSATFRENLLKELGLDDRSYTIFKGESPIPKEQREIRVWPIASMTWKNRKESIPKIAEKCMKIADRHHDTKGLIHCTYDTAAAIKDLNLESKQSHRLIFHNQKDKNDKYQEFLATKKPAILVASGMNEGIDLADDLAGWQILTMTMRPNLSDPVNWHIFKTDPELYDYLTIINTEQQTGRVCRNPKDLGYTYILNSDFWWFYKKTHINRFNSLWEDWFSEAIVLPKR